MGDFYRLLFASHHELMRALETVPIGMVVLDQFPDRQYRHIGQLIRALREHRDRWEHIATLPGVSRETKVPDRYLVYRLRGHEGRVPTLRASALALAYGSVRLARRQRILDKWKPNTSLGQWAVQIREKGVVRCQSRAIF